MVVEIHVLFCNVRSLKDFGVLLIKCLGGRSNTSEKVLRVLISTMTEVLDPSLVYVVGWLVEILCNIPRESYWMQTHFRSNKWAPHH